MRPRTAAVRPKQTEEEDRALVIGHSEKAKMYVLDIGFDQLFPITTTTTTSSPALLQTFKGKILYATYVIFGIRVRSEPFVLVENDHEEEEESVGPFSQMRDCFLLKSTANDLQRFFASSAPLYVELFETEEEEEEEEILGERGGDPPPRSSIINVGAGAVPLGYELAFHMAANERARGGGEIMMQKVTEEEEEEEGSEEENSESVAEIEVRLRQKIFAFGDRTPIAELHVTASVRKAPQVLTTSTPFYSSSTERRKVRDEAREEEDACEAHKDRAFRELLGGGDDDIGAFEDDGDKSPDKAGEYRTLHIEDAPPSSSSAYTRGSDRHYTDTAEKHGAVPPTTALAVAPPTPRLAVDDGCTHRYRLSIDLRSLKNVRTERTFDAEEDRVFVQYLFARHSLQPETTGDMVRTRPSVTVSSDAEVGLPHGFRIFEFDARWRRLVEALKEPLYLQLRRDKAPRRKEDDEKARRGRRRRAGGHHHDDDDDSETPLLAVAAAELAVVCRPPSPQVPIFYRCPSTGETFSDHAAWISHAQSLEGGGNSKNVMLSPVILRAFDAYLPLVRPMSPLEGKDEEERVERGRRQSASSTSAHEGDRVGLVRVVIYLEDLGRVVGSRAQSSGMSTRRTAAATAGRRTRRGGAADNDDDDDDDMHSSSFDDSNSSSIVRYRMRREREEEALRKERAERRKRELEQLESTRENLREWEDRLSKRERAVEDLVNERVERVREQIRASVAERASAAKGREKDREKALESAQAKFAKLEIELKQTLRSAEKRERALQAARSKLKVEAEARASKLKADEKRLMSDMESRAELEAQRLGEIRRRLRATEEERDVAERRRAEIEAEFLEYRREQRRTPEATLRAKALESETEATRLRADLNAEKRAHQESKRQVAQLVVALRRRERMEQERRDYEARQLRLQYAAREQQLVLDGDRRKLQEIRSDLYNLKAAKTTATTRRTGRGEARRKSKTTRSARPRQGTRALSSFRGVNDENNEATRRRFVAEVGGGEEEEEEVKNERVRGDSDSRVLSRLRSRREQLLQTVGYGKDHPLVKQLAIAIENAEGPVAGASVS